MPENVNNVMVTQRAKSSREEKSTVPIGQRDFVKTNDPLNHKTTKNGD